MLPKHKEGTVPRRGISFLPAGPKGVVAIRRPRIYVRWSKAVRPKGGVVISLSKEYGIELRWMFV